VKYLLLRSFVEAVNQMRKKLASASIFYKMFLTSKSAAILIISELLSNREQRDQLLRIVKNRLRIRPMQQN
jgi:hypothetical protein